MSRSVIAERDFVSADQEQFAALSGDRNPMHMDAVATRRTMAGFLIVHGIHTLLWSLDSLFRNLPDLASVASINVRFDKMIYVGDRVQAVLTDRDERRLRLEVVVEGTTAIRIGVVFGDPAASNDTISNEPLLQPKESLVLTFEQMIDCHGRVSFSSALGGDAGRMFPAAAGALGTQRVEWLVCSSFLVGMVCPGLHSIYSSLNLTTTQQIEDNRDALYFRVAHSDSRFRLVRLAVSGGGWTGSLDTLVRPDPTTQADLSRIATNVAPGEFRDANALVIGGSRGLGEVISKILVAGGAHVTLTYSVGEVDARRVQAEITAGGGRCDVMHYDAVMNAQEQLSHLQTIPNQVYYLATPPIFRRKGAVFIEQRFRDFLAFYVTGFYDLCRELRSKAGKDISIFYPSSVSVDTRPANMTEYTMAKAAGEILCADMQSFESPGPILVQRLPRLPTDQTATLSRVDAADPINVMLAIVREVHANMHTRNS